MGRLIDRYILLDLLRVTLLTTGVLDELTGDTHPREDRLAVRALIQRHFFGMFGRVGHSPPPVRTHQGLGVSDIGDSVKVSSGLD